MLNVILVKDFELAKEKAQELKNKSKRVASVEAEYGDNVLNEKFVDLALYHHGKYSKKPCPSIRWDLYNKLKNPFDDFIISHIDADALFGIMWASKILKPTRIAKTIARIIATADIFGFHYVEKFILSKLNENIKMRYLAIGYYITNISLGDNQEKIIDVSRKVHKTILKIKDIIIEGPTKELVEKIKFWYRMRENDAIKHRVAISKDKKVQLFNSNKNLLSAYCLTENCAEININFNGNNGALTISAFNKNIVKKYFLEFEGGLADFMKYFYKNLGYKNWGGAGGRFNVAGSPRELINDFETAKKLFKVISNRVKKYSRD